jgi:phosphatidylserine/phosphatidylglycerophosphate/cardiolipin synthase-like enzyme
MLLLRAMILVFCFPLVARAKFEVPGFELVVTPPAETVLQNEDLRSTTAVWLELIQGAKKTIDLGQMYASGQAGEPLERILEALEEAGTRGVKMRMLLEAKMQRASVPETVDRLKKMKGMDLRVMEFGKLGGDGIQHAKYIVVDRKAAYVGSANFDWRSLKHIHEVGLKITQSKMVRQVQAIFDQDWKAQRSLSLGRRVPPLQRKPTLTKGREKAYLVASPSAYNPKGIAYSEAELVRLISTAKEEIRVQVMDYYPLNRDKTFYPPIDNALRASQARNVKIKLLVSHWNTAKPGIDHLKSLSVLPGVEVKILTIPEAAQGPIPFARVTHSKFMSIDGKRAWIGTSNWTGGYLDNSRNLEVVLQDDKMAQRLDRLHDQMWNSEYAKLVELGTDYPKPNKGGE